MKETKFKMTEVGVIPADWEIADLNNKTSSAIYGVSASAISFDGKHKYIRITDIDDVTGDFVPKPLVSPSFFQTKHIVHENDLLIARTGATVGKTYVYKKTDGNLIFAGFLMRISIKQANAKYIFFQTQTPYYKKWVISESARTGQPGLNIQQLLSLILPFPPIPEQEHIAFVLSNIDTLIGSLDKLITKKQAIKQGAMQQLLTGKTRLGNLTKQWTRKKIYEICEINPKGELPAKFIYIDLESVFKGNLIKKQYIELKSAPSRAQRITTNGDILYQLVRPYQKNNYYNTLNEDIVVSTGYAVLRENKVHNKFLFYLMHLSSFTKDVIDRCTGTGYPAITSNNLGEIEILLPEDKNEQRAIARILTNMDKEIASLQAEKEKYLKMKQGMMQQLLTGKIRLI